MFHVSGWYSSYDSGVRSHRYMHVSWSISHILAADTITSHMTTPGYVQYDQGTDMICISQHVHQNCSDTQPIIFCLYSGLSIVIFWQCRFYWLKIDMNKTFDKLLIQVYKPNQHMSVVKRAYAVKQREIKQRDEKCWPWLEPWMLLLVLQIRIKIFPKNLIRVCFQPRIRPEWQNNRNVLIL